MEKVQAYIERGDDGTNGVYIDLENDSLNYGIHGSGTTVEDAIQDFKSAYEAMKELYIQKGKHFEEAEFSYQYDTASFLSYYGKILSLAGLERLTGINQGQLSHYATGRRKTGKKQQKK